jgi:hypothetical protein
LSSKVVKEYYGANIYGTTETYQYNNDNMLSSVTTTDSKGRQRKKEIIYPKDITSAYNLSSGILSIMTNRRMLNKAIETIEYVDSQAVTSTLNEYAMQNDQINLKYTYLLETNHPLPSINKFNGTNRDSHYPSSPDGTYIFFNDRIVEIKTKQGVVSYLWSYNYLYPVAQFKNLSFSALQSHLSISPDAFARSLTPDFSLIELLRPQLPKVQITTYAYKPLYGITSITNSRGLTMQYSYSSPGLLQWIYNQDQEPIKQYIY